MTVINCKCRSYPTNHLHRDRLEKRLTFNSATDKNRTVTMDDAKDIAYLHANGVIDNIDGYVGILVPLYSKCIITAFRPESNGETRYYGLKVNESFDEYLKEKDGGLNVHAILNKYRQYVRRRGFKAFDTENLKEAAVQSEDMTAFQSVMENL